MSSEITDDMNTRIVVVTSCSKTHSKKIVLEKWSCVFATSGCHYNIPYKSRLDISYYCKIRHNMDKHN